MVTMTADEILTVEDVADRLKVKPYTIKAWLRSGRLRGFRLGGPKSEWRIRSSALEQYIAEQEAQPITGDDDE